MMQDAFSPTKLVERMREIAEQTSRCRGCMTTRILYVEDNDDNFLHA
jgi:hypothetical protein